jgi:hypothetical protein
VVRRMAASSRATWSLYGRPVKLTPSHRLYGLSAILLVALTIGRATMLSEPDRVKATDFTYPGTFVCHPTPHSIIH